MGAVLKKRHAAFGGWLGWVLAELVVGRWDLDIKGEFETEPRNIVIPRAPTYPL